MATYSRAGIKRFIAWKKGTADTYPFSFDVRKGSSFEAETQTIKDHHGREIPKSVLFKAEAEGYNIGRPALETLHAFVKDGGCYAEILGEIIGTGVYSGKYAFNSLSKFLGVEFEYSMTNEERLVKLMLNADLPLDVAKDITTLALLDDAATIGGMAVNRFDASEIRVPNLAYVKYGSGLNLLFENEELISRNFTVKTKSASTTERGRAVVHKYEISAEFVVTNCSKERIDELVYLADFAPAVVIRENDPSGKYEEHNFADNVLSMKATPTITDEKREMKITLAGEVPINCMTPSSSSGSYTYTYIV